MFEIFFGFFFWGSLYADGPCQPRCAPTQPSPEIIADLDQRCLCYSLENETQQRCIEIAIATEGPLATFTTDVPSPLSGCNGTKFDFRRGNGTRNPDDGDCLDTGIPDNTRRGI